MENAPTPRKGRGREKHHHPQGGGRGGGENSTIQTEEKRQQRGKTAPTKGEEESNTTTQLSFGAAAFLCPLVAVLIFFSCPSLEWCFCHPFFLWWGGEFLSLLFWMVPLFPLVLVGAAVAFPLGRCCLPPFFVSIANRHHGRAPYTWRRRGRSTITQTEEGRRQHHHKSAEKRTTLTRAEGRQLHHSKGGGKPHHPQGRRGVSSLLTELQHRTVPHKVDLEAAVFDASALSSMPLAIGFSMNSSSPSAPVPHRP